MSLTYSFGKQQRLLKSTDFKYVFAQPYRISNGFFTMLARPNQVGHARLGLAMSKRYIKRATQRNRLKRLIRESFRLHQHLLPDWDCVVLAKTMASQARSHELLTAIAQQWQQLVQDGGNSPPPTPPC